MLIQLTDPGKFDFYLAADLILAVLRNPQNPLETLVMLKIASPQGPLTYAVTDSPSSIAQAVNRALNPLPSQELIHGR